MSQALVERFGLVGRTALVTGARAGIGRACAVALADAGADLVLWGHRDDLHEVTADVVSRGRKARTVAGDLADPDAVRATAELVLAGGDVDILVNNAGMIHRGPALSVDSDAWRRVLQVNLDSAFALCQLLGGPMCERGHGKIVNIASLLSFQGGINVSSYAASKHAIAGLTKALATEWAGLGVNVNAVAPGYVLTDVTEVLVQDQTRFSEISLRIPAGRWAEPADIAGAVTYLASRAADYVHGHVLVVDGGWLAR